MATAFTISVLSWSEDSKSFHANVVDFAYSSSLNGRLRPFLVQQRELCERADLDTTAEAAREVDLHRTVMCGSSGDVLEPFRLWMMQSRRS